MWERYIEPALKTQAAFASPGQQTYPTEPDRPMTVEDKIGEALQIPPFLAGEKGPLAISRAVRQSWPIRPEQLEAAKIALRKRMEQKRSR